MRIHWSGLLLAACFATGACASAEYVSRTSDGGVVKTLRDSRGNKVKAMELMRMHCPGGYLITAEGEVPVGTVTTQDIRTQPNIFDGTDIRDTTRTRTLTEWHIRFTCK